MQNAVIKLQSPWYKRKIALLCRVIHRLHEYTVLPSFSSAWFFFDNMIEPVSVTLLAHLALIGYLGKPHHVINSTNKL
jgi:hypothetical protein